MDQPRELEWSYAAAGLVTGGVVGVVTGAVTAGVLLTDPVAADAELLIAGLGFGLLLGCVVGGLTGAVLSLWASSGPAIRRPSLLGTLLLSAVLGAALALLAVGPEGFRGLFSVLAPACLVGSILLRPVATRLRAVARQG